MPRHTQRVLQKNGAETSDWAGKAVTQSVSATAEDALQMHVIDLVATDCRRSADQN